QGRARVTWPWLSRAFRYRGIARGFRYLGSRANARACKRHVCICRLGQDRTRAAPCARSYRQETVVLRMGRQDAALRLRAESAARVPAIRTAGRSQFARALPEAQLRARALVHSPRRLQTLAGCSPVVDA